MVTVSFTFEIGCSPFAAAGARIVAAAVVGAFFLRELAAVGVELLRVAAE